MLKTLVLAAILAGLLVSGYRIWGFYEPAGEVAASRAGPALPAEAQPPAEDDVPPELRRERNVRDVTPEGVFSGAVSAGRQVETRPRTARRSDPSAERSGPSAERAAGAEDASEPEPDRPKTARYFRVVVADAGTIEAKDTTIRLEGIEAPADDATCTDGSGAEWPCGRAAKAAMALFLRGRAIDCDTVEDGGDTVTTSCRSGDEDLAGWLVAQGWAKPAPGSPYAEAGDDAKAQKLGLYREAWRRDLDEAPPASPAIELVRP